MPESMKTILLTGANGYLGRSLIQCFSKQGRLTALARSPMDFPNKEIKTFKGSLADLPTSNIKAETVIHFANPNESDFRNSSDSVIKPEAHLDPLFRFCQKEKVKKIIFASSVRVYDGCQENEIREETIPRPTNDYAKWLFESENLVRNFGSQNNCQVLVFRFGNVFGGLPRDIERRPSVVPYSLCRQALAGQIELESSGLQKRDFISISGLEPYFHEALKLEGEIQNDVWNLVSGSSISVLEVAQIVSKEASKLQGKAVSVKMPAQLAPERPDHKSFVARFPEPEVKKHLMSSIAEFLRWQNASKN